MKSRDPGKEKKNVPTQFPSETRDWRWNVGLSSLLMRKFGGGHPTEATGNLSPWILHSDCLGAVLELGGDYRVLHTSLRSW